MAASHESITKGSHFCPEMFARGRGFIAQWPYEPKDLRDDNGPILCAYAGCCSANTRGSAGHQGFERASVKTSSEARSAGTGRLKRNP